MTAARNWRPLLHRAEIVVPPGSREAISLPHLLESRRGAITSASLRTLATRGEELSALLEHPGVRAHADLRHGAEGLRRLLASDAVQSSTDPLPDWLSEAGVCLEYLLEDKDLIPDTVSEIGFIDDARLLAVLFSRHPELQPYCPTP